MRFSKTNSIGRTAAFVTVFCLVAAFVVSAGCANREQGVTPSPAAPPATDSQPRSELPTTTPLASNEPDSTPTPEPTATPEPTPAQDYSGGIKKENRKTTVSLFGDGNMLPFCGTGHTIAVQFYATTEFSAVGFKSPTWKSTENYYVDYFLYKWDTDYIDTTNGKPVAEGFFENWQDGITVSLKFDPLPAGEYVLVALYGSLESMSNSGVWYKDQEHVSQRSYLDDEIWYDAAVCCEIVYIHTPNNKYGPLSDSGLE